MIYDVKYFIEKFEAIPDEKWTTGKFYDEKTGACCALGWCDKRKDSVITEEAKKLYYILRQQVAGINDGNTPFTKLGKTPKERIFKRT